MSIITLLSNIQPLIIIGMLLLMYSIETVRPYLAKPSNKKKHDSRNWVLALINFVINGLLAVGVTAALQFSANKHFGLLNALPLTNTMRIVLGIFLIDLGSYTLHLSQHKVPFFWSFHRVHHSDANLNASSALRFHPFDTLLSQGIWQAFWFSLMGISMTSVVIYGTCFLPLFIMQHSNVQLPNWFEKYARYLISTPGWHKIHHAADQQYTDSHYGDFFTIWDRLFGTWTPVDPAKIEYGLHEFKADERNTIGFLLMAPFKKLKRN